jgi:hypothetical protein
MGDFMNRAVALDWTERLERATITPRVDERARVLQLTRENMRLAEENARLRAENEDLAASAEIWIRLYEAALSRTKQAAVGMTAAVTRGFARAGN